jgi:hypothetical protein
LALLGRGGGAPVETTPWLGRSRGGRRRRGGVRLGLAAGLALRTPQLPSGLVVLDAREPARAVSAERRGGGVQLAALELAPRVPALDPPQRAAPVAQPMAVACQRAPVRLAQVLLRHGLRRGD